MSESLRGEADSPTDQADNNVCEWCGDSLATPSGLRRHKRLKHEDKLDNPCPTCGKQFTSDRGVKIHHKRSHGESLSYVTETCVYCGDTFEYKWHTRPNAKYCNEVCRDKHQTGEKHPHWKGGKVKLECDWCGGPFKVDPHEGEFRRFCGQSCSGAWLGSIQTGENNPSWSGGKLWYYGPNWHQKRREARQRDNHECQDCGIHRIELGKEMPVHHIIPRKDFIDSDGVLDYERANRLDNLVCLCPPCHRKWEGLYVRPDPRGN